MVHAIEFHGRLCDAEGGPARAGRYDLDFALHVSPDGGTALWEEEVRGVAVAADGSFRTVLGAGSALRAELFDGSPRYLAVRLAALEARVARLDGTAGRVARLEDEMEDIVGPDGDLVDLTERLDAIEKGRARPAR
jgi:hypothetical protein